MQASSQWTPPQGTLGRISHEAEQRAQALLLRHVELERLASSTPAGPSLRSALLGEAVGVIAEVKRRSPSKGSIAPALDPVTQARAYANGGAAAVSILTEPVHFGGSADDLAAARAALTIPVLKKDFHVAPIQLVEARALGASAALLIARALSPRQLPELMEWGHDMGLELLVEIRDGEELVRALQAGATLIGVNNRNLETLEIDPTTCDRLLPMIPAGIVVVAESGVQSRADVERYAAMGADAVLVGSVLSASPNPSAATRDLATVKRRVRGG